MRRVGLLLAGSVASVAGLTSVVAIAATTSESGHVTGAPSSVVALKVVTRGRTPSKVTGLFVRGAPATCQGGPPTASIGYPGSLKIAADRTFHGKATLSG